MACRPTGRQKSSPNRNADHAGKEKIENAGAVFGVVLGNPCKRAAHAVGEEYENFSRQKKTYPPLSKECDAGRYEMPRKSTEFFLLYPCPFSGNPWRFLILMNWGGAPAESPKELAESPKSRPREQFCR
jgi:hypothetical protein